MATRAVHNHQQLISFVFVTFPFSVPAGANPRFRDESAVYKQLRERYLMFVNCVESAPGKEPKAAYLYPQAAVPAAQHH